MTCPRLPRTPDGSGAPLGGHEEGVLQMVGPARPVEPCPEDYQQWLDWPHPGRGQDLQGGLKGEEKKAERQLLGGSETSRAEAAVPRPVNNVILVDVLRYLVNVGVKLLSFLQVTVSVEFVKPTMRDKKEGAEGSWEGGETPPGPNHNGYESIQINESNINQLCKQTFQYLKSTTNLNFTVQHFCVSASRLF